MTRRDPETSPPAFLGAELRRARMAAGFSSQETLAARLGFDRSVVAKAETGDRPPTDDVLGAWCKACGLDDELFGRLVLLARRADGLMPTWFEDWPDLEAAATTLRWFEPLLVPGLLQTEMYARALYATRVVLSQDDIDSHIAARLKRQEILARENPPMLWIMIEAAQRPTVRIEVIHAGIGAHDGLTGAFIIAELPNAPSAAYREGARKGQVVRDPEQVAELMVCWDTLRSEALSRNDSLALLEEAAKTWTSAA